MIPKSFDEEKSPAIIVDLGRLVVQSDPTARDKAIEYKEGMEFSLTEEYFYDTFDVKLIGMHALLTDSKSNWRTMARHSFHFPTRFFSINIISHNMQIILHIYLINDDVFYRKLQNL